MRILHITTQKPHSTGSGIYLTELVKSFDKLGFFQGAVFGVYKDDGNVFPKSTLTYPIYYSKDKEKADIPYKILGMSDQMPYPSTQYRNLNDEMLAQLKSAFIPKIKRAIADIKPDLIICHHLFLLTSIISLEFPDENIVGVCHGSDLRQMELCNFHRDDIVNGINNLKKIFVLNSVQVKKVRSLFNITDSKIKIIGSGYNNSIFNSDGRAIKLSSDYIDIVYAGKISRAKGVLELKSALDLLDIPKDIKIRVFWAGGISDSSFMNHFDIDFAKKNCNKNFDKYIFNYMGMLSQSELAELFKSSDIFILPSYYEGIPLVLIEAMASGMIPISTNPAGVKEWIDQSVPNHNVHFVNLPQMVDVDIPLQSEIPDFVQRLKKEIENTVTEIYKLRVLNKNIDIPKELSTLSWDGVAKKIIDSKLC